MTIHLPLIALIAVLGYLGYRLIRPPLWLVTVLVLGGYLSAGSVLGPAIDSGTRAGLAVVNGAAGDAKGGDAKGSGARSGGARSGDAGPGEAKGGARAPGAAGRSHGSPRMR